METVLGKSRPLWRSNGKITTLFREHTPFKNEYETIWWIRSEDPQTCASDYACLAAELDLPEKEAREQEQTINAVKRWLGQHDKWLLVFDNVNEPDDIDRYLPQASSGHVLITSRNPNWQGIAEQLKIEVMSPDESIAFIIKRTRENDPDNARKLADELGHLPLALEQAGAYIEACGKTIAEYVSLYKKRHAELLNKGKPSTKYPHSVATTWTMAFEKLPEEAVSMLNVCSFMAPDAIPWNLFAEEKEKILQKDINPIIKTTLQDPLQFDEAVEVLRKYSLVELKDGIISIHRLVQTVTRDRLTEEKKRAWLENALRIIDVVFPDESYDVRFWPVCSKLLSHAQVVINLADELKVQTTEIAHLLNQIAEYLYSLAEYSRAEPLYWRSLSIYEQQLGQNHPHVAASLDNTAQLLHSQGKYAEVEPLYRRSLSIREQQLGPDHPDVATSLNNLAKLLYSQGKHAKAEPLYRRAVDILEKTLGTDHPTTVKVRKNLDSLLVAVTKSK